MGYTPVPFYHTYILYNPDDIVSTACVQLSLFPIYVMVFYTLWFLVTREIQPVITVGGHLIGEILNSVIKHLIKQPRPDFHKNFGNYGSGKSASSLSHGMPSAHSQFMGFFASYFMCVVFLQTPGSTFHKLRTSVFLVGSSVGVAFSRVYLQYHTTPQVIVGWALGVLWGLVYFVVLSLVRDVGLVDWVLLWRVVRYFSIKDSYFISYQLFADESRRVDELRHATATKTRLPWKTSVGSETKSY